MCRIILGGTGGQGVITLGKLLAIAGMNEGFNVSCYPIYGAEMRGGYAFSTVIFSRAEVPSPIVARAELGIFLDPLAFDYLAGMVGRRGMLVVNSEQVPVDGCKDRRIVPVAALSAARTVGDERCANMVVAGYTAGAAAGRLDPFPGLAALEKALPEVFPGKKNVIALNEAALQAGYRQAAGRRSD